MKLHAQRLAFETYTDTGGSQAMFEVKETLTGCALDIFLRHACNGRFYLCKRKDTEGHGLHIVATPSSRWKAELADAGYEVIYAINTSVTDAEKLRGNAP